MKVNSINNNQINTKRQTFKGYSNPGFYALRSQIVSAEDADKFVKAMKQATKQDATATNFMSAFVNKVIIAGEILGFKNLQQAGKVMSTPQHKALVKEIDKGVDALLEATGYASAQSLDKII